MKKSKFLKSSKDMLFRSFNPSKCKTSLRLASSRVKLLRNKKEGEVMQIRREISLLLQSGQDQTARIRVEHMVREEKMVVAYELIGIYCELIVSRLSIIETQKICPIDLKEAIASVVYASLRCGDVPELSKVKKQFKEKYGKDFITAAVELRPECGVSRMLIEKLSTVAPDGQTKHKILSGIAQEYKVKWDAEAFEQKSTPASGFLSGPSAFVKENGRPLNEPLRSQGPDIKPPQSNQLHESERLVSTQVSVFNSSFQREATPSGDERSCLSRGYNYSILNDRRRWSMDFKDATSAAQAAAESAELASMAARAAAHLSTHERMARKYSNELQDSDRDGAPDTYMRPSLGSEQYSNQSFKNQAEGSDHAREETYRKQERFTSSHSHTSISSNVNSYSNGKDQDFDYHGGENTSSDHGKERNYKKGSRESFRGSGVVFDRSDSDTDYYGFDRSPTYDEPQESSASGFRGQSKNGSKLDDSVSVTFDESDEQTPESEEKRSVRLRFKDKVRMPFRSPSNESPQYDQTQLSLSSDYESEETDSRSQVKKFDADPPPKFNLARTSAHQPTLVPKRNRNDVGNSSPERGEGLNFAKLTGGFRHKGYNYSWSSRKESEATTAKITTFSSLPPAESPRMRTVLECDNRKPRLLSTSDTDSSQEGEDSLRKNLNHKYKLYTTERNDLITKPSFAASSSFIDPENSDSDEDLPKGSLKETTRLCNGISRRTKAFPSNHEKEKYSRMQLRSQVHSDDGMDEKAKTSTKLALDHATATSGGDISMSMHGSEEPYQHKSENAGSGIKQESKLREKSCASEERTVPAQRKSELNLNKTSSNKDSSNLKASHVHPKLPDYDSLVQIFQKNRS